MILWQANDFDARSARQHHTTFAASARVEDEHSRAGHERRTDERFGARGLVFSVEEHGTRPHAPQRLTRSFTRLREVRLMSHELDSSSQQGGGERIS